ncbi:MAG: anhydro-N-acetylmuramic acid kinase [Alphaproteobacteria bacterium]|nr:anhydro-N-acetylmuramic acid kinase [Alphaproteobacteria bacterium]
METIHSQKVLGLASGSSLDSVSAAIISTDGIDVFDYGISLDVPYDDNLREKLLSAQQNPLITEEQLQTINNELTLFHASIVDELQKNYNQQIDLIGLKGHYLPQSVSNIEIGNGQLLANSTGIKTISRFRQSDILAGGLGAPLSAIFHQSLSSSLPKPCAIIDIGGISSLTWIGHNGEITAFDIGPGNSTINHWVNKHGGQHMDYNGTLAATGTINHLVCKQLMHHKFIAKYPPKIADINTFKDKLEHLEGLSLADGASTVTAFVAEAIAYSVSFHLPDLPQIIVICGGGAHNPTLVRFIRQQLPNIDIRTASELLWNASAIEAQAFAFLAARRINFLPSTYPFTTGVSEPCICGEIFNPK